jgi:hypothetical protein
LDDPSGFSPEFQAMKKSGNPSEDTGKDAVYASSQYLGHGMALAASVALFGWVGFKVGERVGYESLLTLFGMLFGGAAGFYSLYVQMVVRPRLEQDQEESETD